MTTPMTTRMTSMITDDPWRGLTSPPQPTRISARRISDVGTPDWGLYWGLDSQHHCLLILQHRSAQSNLRRLPKLRGLRVEAHRTEERSGRRLIIRLTDSEQRDVFHRFCTDIVEATRASRSEAEAVDRFLIRTWRWHFLLRGGGSRLSREEQRGLVGELCLLERRLLPVIGPVGAVQAWTGPVGADKDFQVGWIGVEAKTRSPHAPLVRISSADQLDSVESSRLFLHVVEVSGAQGDPTSVTITDVALRVRDSIAALDMQAASQFEERLCATGFDFDDDYSDNRLVIGGASLYEVLDGFPRITPAMFLPGVMNVRYAIELSRCKKFHIDMAILAQAIKEMTDDN